MKEKSPEKEHAGIFPAAIDLYFYIFRWYAYSEISSFSNSVLCLI